VIVEDDDHCVTLDGPDSGCRRRWMVDPRPTPCSHLTFVMPLISCPKFIPHNGLAPTPSVGQSRYGGPQPAGPIGRGKRITPVLHRPESFPHCCWPFPTLPFVSRVSHSLNSVAHWVWFPFGAVLQFIARSGKRVAVTVVGFVLLLAGIVMIVTPGPGILLIIAGMAVLATEYVWAERLLNLTKRKAVQAKDSIIRRNRSRSHETDAGSGDQAAG
jgi:hypothetical protein